MKRNEKIEVLALDIISYEAFVQDDPKVLSVLKKALNEKGIVGIKGIPGYKEQALKFIEEARAFSSLPEIIKEAYTADHSQGVSGYENGKEQFMRADGSWVVDDLKVYYYGFVPDCPPNKWPLEVDLKTPFQNLGALMSEVGEAVMQKVGLLGPDLGISIDGIPRLGRMLHYRKSGDSEAENPLWCGSHFDHGLFTVLLPGYYFVNGQQVAEPAEAGLFIKTTLEEEFQKVIADDPEVMLFQVGEFAQLATDDAIRATEHRVHKALGAVERYTMALFFDPSLEAVIHSYSELTTDARYGGLPGEPCSYRHWNEESYNRYLIKENEGVR